MPFNGTIMWFAVIIVMNRLTRFWYIVVYIDLINPAIEVRELSTSK